MNRKPSGATPEYALTVTTIEDRVVQKAAAWVISAVFEQDFLDCSYGFRPNRSAHGRCIGSVKG